MYLKVLNQQLKGKFSTFYFKNLTLDGKKLSFELKTPFKGVLESNTSDTMLPKWNEFLNTKWEELLRFPDADIMQMEQLLAGEE